MSFTDKVDPHVYNSPNFDLLVSMGEIPGIDKVDKFGKAVDGVQTTATDIWDRADAATTQQIWLAPTDARVHTIVSTSANDDGDPAGTGARTVRIYGLRSWDLKETSEDITLNGTTGVNTVNSYVIIHRMIVLTCGASGPNVGVISATAATDSTVTAAILAGQGQTQMAIYGVPSIQTLYLKDYYLSIERITSAAYVGGTLLVNPFPDDQPTVFLTKDNKSVISTGTSSGERVFRIPKEIPGPAIVKIQGLGSAADIFCAAGFNGYLIDN